MAQKPPDSRKGCSFQLWTPNGWQGIQNSRERQTTELTIHLTMKFWLKVRMECCKATDQERTFNLIFHFIDEDKSYSKVKIETDLSTIDSKYKANT